MVDLVFMPDKRQQLGSVRRIPYLGRSIATGRDDAASTLIPRRVGNRATVGVKRKYFLPACCIPHAGIAVKRKGDHACAALVPRCMHDLTLVPGERERCPSAGVPDPGASFCTDRCDACATLVPGRVKERTTRFHQGSLGMLTLGLCEPDLYGAFLADRKNMRSVLVPRHIVNPLALLGEGEQRLPTLGIPNLDQTVGAESKDTLPTWIPVCIADGSAAFAKSESRLATQHIPYLGKAVATKRQDGCATTVPHGIDDRVVVSAECVLSLAGLCIPYHCYLVIA